MDRGQRIPAEGAQPRGDRLADTNGAFTDHRQVCPCARQNSAVEPFDAVFGRRRPQYVGRSIELTMPSVGTTQLNVGLEAVSRECGPSIHSLTKPDSRERGGYPSARGTH
jgi:hypothetical protein